MRTTAENKKRENGEDFNLHPPFPRGSHLPSHSPPDRPCLLQSSGEPSYFLQRGGRRKVRGMASRGMKKKKKGPNGWKYHSRTRRTKLPICLGRSFLFSDSVLFSFALFRSLSIFSFSFVFAGWLVGSFARSLARLILLLSSAPSVHRHHPPRRIHPSRSASA